MQHKLFLLLEVRVFQFDSSRLHGLIYESHESYRYFLWLRFPVQHQSRITPGMTAKPATSKPVAGGSGTPRNESAFSVVRTRSGFPAFRQIPEIVTHRRSSLAPGKKFTIRRPLGNASSVTGFCPPRYLAARPLRLHRATRSCAASGHVGYANWNPASSKRPGTTRRLLRTNSDSVRSRYVPTSSIHLVAGRPARAPHAFLRMRRNSRFGSGFGEARFTAPVSYSLSMRNSTERMKSAS